MTLQQKLYATYLERNRLSAQHSATTDAVEAEFFSSTIAQQVAFLVGRTRLSIRRVVALLVECGAVTDAEAELYLAQVNHNERDGR